MTSHIEGRVVQHRNGTFKGFTSKYRCNRLVWYLRFPYVEDAIAYEKKIKGWTRARKVALIEAENPTWDDLSAEWGKQAAPYDWSAEANRKQILRSAQDDTAPIESE
ncbi:GIY-YIG nuclease family protein [Terriglobus aquaticus]|uniref:GIY-YIG nuclease family protein n=1 Tax=Terriglobus aquaticus TaxID=940139 RepID=A0ABW9KFL9_9BACT|nr:GIY-YIG nuclease family protein [Terriglobus aquaticus]